MYKKERKGGKRAHLHASVFVQAHISQTSRALINSEGERSHLAKQSLLIIRVSQSHRSSTCDSAAEIHLSFALSFSAPPQVNLSNFTPVLDFLKPAPAPRAAARRVHSQAAPCL